jgi:hypothetical protein
MRDGSMAQHCSIGPSGEGSRVQQQSDVIVVYITKAITRRAREQLSIFIHSSVELNPIAPVGASPFVSRLTCNVTEFVLLPECDGWIQVIEDKRQFLSRLPPVNRTEHCTIETRREHQLKDPGAILPDPQDPIARRYPSIAEPRGKSLDAI